MRASLIFLVLLLLLGVPVRAQPAAEPVYLLVVDSEGAWQVERQERFIIPPTLPGAGGLSTSWKALLDTRPFRQLSYEDRLALMAYPERLLASSWAAQAFRARHVLVLRPLAEERVQGRLFDLLTGRDQAVVVDNERQGNPRERALALALEKAGIAREPVVAHPEGLYHRAHAAHLSEQAHYEPVESAQRAEQFGFSPCGLCYPMASRDPLYDELDRNLGDLVASQIEATYPLTQDGEATARVQRVGQRLLRENRFLDQGYRFEVLETTTINAYCAPTGPVYLTTGLLASLETDDELAAVLGHELSHSERKHARRQYESAQQTGMLGLMVTVATGFPWASLGTDILGTIMVRGYSRGFELEADRDGMIASYAAGYDPREYLRVQDKLEQAARERGEGGLAWLRTHPGGDERKEQLHAILERTAPLRQQLDALEKRDRGMAVYLKSQLLPLSDEQAALTSYLERYERLARFLSRTPQTSPESESEPEPPVELNL